MAIDIIGSAGGIGIIWNPLEISLSNFLATKSSIFVEFHIRGTSIKGILSSVYGSFSLSPKQAFMNSLKMLNYGLDNGTWF